MKKIISGLMLCCVVGLVGCENLSNWEDQNSEQIEQQKVAGDVISQALAPSTGGWSSTIWAGIVALFTTVTGVNRSIVAQQRKRVIEEVESNPDTPPVSLQVRTGTAKKVVEKMSNVS